MFYEHGKITGGGILSPLTGLCCATVYWVLQSFLYLIKKDKIVLVKTKYLHIHNDLIGLCAKLVLWHKKQHVHKFTCKLLKGNNQLGNILNVMKMEGGEHKEERMQERGL